MTDLSQPIEPDPDTDGIGDGGERELAPLSDEEIEAGVRHDRRHRSRSILSPDTPFAEDPADDRT